MDRDAIIKMELEFKNKLGVLHHRPYQFLLRNFGKGFRQRGERKSRKNCKNSGFSLINTLADKLVL